MKPNQAPFPAWGGKSPVADLVWSRFGSARNCVLPNYDGRNELRMVYEEPFGNSLAILLANPDYDWANGRWRVKLPPIETVNDLDPFISNFWRSIKHAPDGVAEHCDWPVNEADLHSRHKWLVQQGQNWFQARMVADPHFYDVRIAGWWVWGLSMWIGRGWCDLESPKTSRRQRPHLTSNGNGVHRKQIPHSNGRGRDIRAGRRRELLKQWFEALSHRLRNVRVACGDWSRVTGKSVTWNNNCTRGKEAITVAVLDPPYAAEAGRTNDIYAVDNEEVSHQVREWALSEGDNPKMRIALFGYAREHGPHMPDTWECVAWKANGGYGNQGVNENGNPEQERIWFSPHCLKPDPSPQPGQMELII